MQVTCSQCGQDYAVDDTFAGRTAKCPGCGADIRIPSPATPMAQPLAAPTFAHRTPPLRTSTMAVISLILGILGLVLFCIPLVPGVIALILGLIAINKIDNPANGLTGRGAATAGAIMGGISIVTSLILGLLVLGVILPALGAANRTARHSQSNSQVRGIQQGMATYAQGGQSFYPGLDAPGSIVPDGPNTTGNSGTGDVPAARYWILLNGNFFTSDYAISPLDQGKTPWLSGPVTPQNFSYAMLRLNSPNRMAEWKDSINTSAAVVTDRNTGADAHANVQSIHTPHPGDWRGSISRNDNSTLFSTTHELMLTKYGTGRAVHRDNLFADDADVDGNPDNDAGMVYDTADGYVDQK